MGMSMMAVQAGISATYEGLNGCEPNASSIDARHQNGPAANGVGKRLGHFQTFCICIELGVGRSRHDQSCLSILLGASTRVKLRYRISVRSNDFKFLLILSSSDSSNLAILYGPTVLYTNPLELIPRLSFKT